MDHQAAKFFSYRPFLCSSAQGKITKKISARNTVEFTPSEQDSLFPGLTLREKENFSAGHPSYTRPTPLSHPD
jgi:hypothetical protein